MAKQIDHLILVVSDPRATSEFYARVLGFTDEGKEGPFTVIRVSDTFTLQLARGKTSGGHHLAFAMTRAEFDRVFSTIKESGIDYGDAFNTVGTGRGPGLESGARGPGKTIYFFDPDRHLLEIRHYEDTLGGS